MPEGQVLEFSGVTKRYGPVTAVQEFTARIEPGMVTGFLGPNGAGKTTSLRILLGLVSPSAGVATIGGVPYRRLSDPMRSIGAVLESTSFHPGRTARNHLKTYAQAGRIPTSRVDEVLALVGLADAGDRKVGGFSLGMRQRLALAVALLGDPGVLVLDEPTNGLDPEGISWMRSFLRTLAAEGRTVLMSSHLLSEVQQTADSLLMISHGRLVFRGGFDDLITDDEAHTVVDAPDRSALSAALSAAGMPATLLRSGFTVRGASTAAVGAVAASAGIPLSSLVRRGPSLEDVFFQLVNGDRIHPSASAGAAIATAPEADAHATAAAGAVAGVGALTGAATGEAASAALDADAAVVGGADSTADDERAAESPRDLAGGGDDGRVADTRDDADIAASSDVPTAITVPVDDIQVPADGPLPTHDGLVIAAAAVSPAEPDETVPVDTTADVDTDVPGTDVHAVDLPGIETTGQDVTGPDATGPDATGPDATDVDATDAHVTDAHVTGAAAAVTEAFGFVAVDVELPDVADDAPEAPAHEQASEVAAPEADDAPATTDAVHTDAVSTDAVSTDAPDLDAAAVSGEVEDSSTDGEDPPAHADVPRAHSAFTSPIDDEPPVRLSSGDRPWWIPADIPAPVGTISTVMGAADISEPAPATADDSTADAEPAPDDDDDVPTTPVGVIPHSTPRATPETPPAAPTFPALNSEIFRPGAVLAARTPDSAWAPPASTEPAPAWTPPAPPTPGDNLFSVAATGEIAVIRTGAIPVISDDEAAAAATADAASSADAASTTEPEPDDDDEDDELARERGSWERRDDRTESDDDADAFFAMFTDVDDAPADADPATDAEEGGER